MTFELEFVDRILGGYRDHAGRGGLAEIETLRALQHLQLSHVHIRVVNEATDIHHHAVDVDGHRLVKGRADGARTNAAQVQVGSVAGTTVVYAEVRHQAWPLRSAS